MGRPIKRKFFGVDNVADGLTYSDAGGEGISSFTYTNRGSNYSQGLTATVAFSPIAGNRATIVPVVSTANGRVNSVTVTSAGTGYLTAPALTFTKPDSVAVTGTNDAFWQDGSNIRLSSTAGLYVGMFSNVAGHSSVYITNIYSDGNIRGSNSYGNVSTGTPILFSDAGTGLNITAVLASVVTTANTIQANAWTTNSGVGQAADIVSQRGSRTYRVSNASDLVDLCRLVPTCLNGVNSPTVTQVISAGGPTAAGQMTILATDSDGGVYLVGKLESRTALLFPAAIGGSAGTQFEAYTQVRWTSTGLAVANTGSATEPSNDAVVKLATND
jgi:hypothetical protein